MSGDSKRLLKVSRDHVLRCFSADEPSSAFVLEAVLKKFLVDTEPEINAHISAKFKHSLSPSRLAWLRMRRSWRARRLWMAYWVVLNNDQLFLFRESITRYKPFIAMAHAVFKEFLIDSKPETLASVSAEFVHPLSPGDLASRRVSVDHINLIGS